MAALGWTFRVPNQHPWIVVSDPKKHPDGHCLVINITDPGNYSAEPPLLQPGDHESITKASVLYYPEAFETSSEKIDERIERGEIVRLPDLNTKVLKKVLNACRQTKFLASEFRHYVQQGEPRI
jgi:hypothetical protein